MKPVRIKRPLTPTFVIRLVGKNVKPSTVPVRMLSDAASSVFRLASGDLNADSDSVHIVDVRDGSAAYGCLTESLEDPKANLQLAGLVVNSSDSELLKLPMLSPIKELSRIAGKIEGRVEVHLSHRFTSPVVTFEEDTYRKIQGYSIVHDFATITGELVRVGGASGKKCCIRIPGRDSLLYCSVRDEELSRQLGQHLYQRVILHGRGMFFARTWDLLRMNVSEATFPDSSDLSQLIRDLRAAGGDGWDRVSNVDAELRKLR